MSIIEDIRNQGANKQVDNIFKSMEGQPLAKNETTEEDIVKSIDVLNKAFNNGDIPVPDLLKAAKNIGKLTKKRKLITRGGRTFLTTVYVDESGSETMSDVAHTAYETPESLKVIEHLHKGDYVKVLRKDGSVVEGTVSGMSGLSTGKIELAVRVEGQKWDKLIDLNTVKSVEKKEFKVEPKIIKPSVQTNIKVLFQTKKGALLITDGEKVAWVMGRSQRDDGSFTDSATKALKESSQTFSQYQEEQKLRQTPVVLTKDSIVQKSDKGAIQFKGKIKYNVEGVGDREVKFWIPPFKMKEENGVISVDRPFFEEESKKVEDQNSLKEFPVNSFTEYDKSYGVSVGVEDYHTEREIGSKVFFPKSLSQKTKSGDLLVPDWLVQQNLTEKVDSYKHGAYQYVQLGIFFKNDLIPRDIKGKLFI